MDTRWDYIIVGGGTAGAVLANRLSADPARQVLLLESGKDYRGSDIPEFLAGRTLATGLTMGPAHTNAPDYYWTDTQARRHPSGPTMMYHRGKGLGGSSSVNGLIAVRPESSDWDRWEASGATGWGAADMTGPLNRLEHDLEYGQAPYHGDTGPIPIYREPRATWGKVDIALDAAGEHLGYPWHDDYNAPHTTGRSRYPVNHTADHRRVSTNHGYLDPVRDERTNLTIRGGAHVVDIIIDHGVVHGVRLRGGEEIRVHPGGEIILSAGAVHSPTILLRSGIGPAHELHRLGIPVIADLPVGQGAQDHAILFVKFHPADGMDMGGGGRPTHLAIRYSSGLPSTGRNDMVLLATNHNYWFGEDTAGIAIQLNESHSRGTLWLPDADPDTAAIIEHRLLTDPVDYHRMLDGLARTIELLEQPEFREIRDGDLVAPRTRSEVIAGTKDVMHLCSTARMGQETDPHTVVDPLCRVKGIQGLRIVDASIFPDIVSANINIAVIALAERAAELLTDNHPAG